MKTERLTGVWQKWRFSVPQTHLWLIKVWFSASTFVVKIATFAKRQNVSCNFRKTDLNKTIMATIKLKRTSEYINRFRNYQIYVDGKKIGTIANGETKEFSISEGQHKIKAEIDWCSSQEIDFNVDEIHSKNFNIGGFKNGKWLMPLGLGLILIGYLINFYYENNFSLLIGLPVFAILFYYVTIGRKKYLTLDVDK